MGDELVIRSVQEPDKNGILDLLKLSLGGGSIPRTLEYWSWKHERNPFGCSAAIIAESEGNIVGLRVFMRWTWDSAGKRIQAVRAVDTATHPRWRGQGIFSRLTRALVEQMRDEQVAIVFNTPNRFSRPGYLKMGWASLGRMSLWIRPRPTLRLARGVLQRTWSKPGVAQEPLPKDRFPPASDLMNQPEVLEFEELGHFNDPSLKTPVELEYLNWRYAEIPEFAYSAAWKWSNGGAAALIFRVNRRGDLRELRLCQTLLNSNPNSPQLARELLVDVIEETRPDYAVCMSTTAKETRALVSAGFLPAPRTGPIFTVRQLNDIQGPLNLFHRSAWRLSIGDLELF